jgi:hypothetical protein
MLVAQHGLSPLLAWLLVFREILIYATRLMFIEHWFLDNKSVRRFSEWHAIGIRTWLLAYILADWGNLYLGINLYTDVRYVATQYTLLALTLTLSYYALLKSILMGLQKV